MPERAVLLAIEASQRLQSVALGLPDGRVEQEPVDAADRSREDLLPAIERVMRRAGVGAEHLSAVLLNEGPGGFTGLRMAHAAAQAMALAREVAVVQVPGAACARQAAIDAGELGTGDACWVALASKGPETWIALADAAGARAGRSIEVHAWDPSGIDALVSDEHLPDTWRAEATAQGLRMLPLRLAAASVLRAGRPMLESGRTVPPEALVPAYPREAEAVRLWRQRHAARPDGTPR